MTPMRTFAGQVKSGASGPVMSTASEYAALLSGDMDLCAITLEL